MIFGLVLALGAAGLAAPAGAAQSGWPALPDLRVRFLAWSGNASAVNAGIKIAAHHLYSVISVGGINIYGSIPEATAFGFHLGLQFGQKKSYAAADFGYMFLDNARIFKTSVGELDQHIIPLRGLVGFHLSPSFTMFAGSGMIYALNYGKKFWKGEVAPLFFVGLELF